MISRIARTEIFKWIVLLSVALGAGPVGAAVWQWSKTADNNANADPSINWAEGMSPSSVNDSARAMMAQIANYRDDISGLLATTGGPTNYAVTTNSGICNAGAITDGQLLSITINVANAAPSSLAADGCPAATILSSAGVPVASASLVAGSPYGLRYSTSNSGWMLKGFYSSATNVALGALVPYTLTTSPNSNFIFAYGQCISTITYATYWNALGSPGPGSCGANQFAVIDMRGTVPVGLDTMPGSSAASRLTSSSLGCGTAMTTVGARCANGNESSSILTTNLPPYTPSGSVTSSINYGGGLQLGFAILSGGCCVGLGGTATGGTPIALNGNLLVSSSFTGSPQGGNGTSMPRIMPSVGLTYLLRVL